MKGLSGWREVSIGVRRVEGSLIFNRWLSDFFLLFKGCLRLLRCRLYVDSGFLGGGIVAFYMAGYRE